MLRKHSRPSNKIAAVVPLSSGLDSTYLLYKILNERPDTDVFVLHVQLIKPIEPYHAIELDRSNKIVELLRAEFPQRIQAFYRPVINLKGHPMGLDTDGVLVMAQKVLYDVVRRCQYELAQLFIGLVADDAEYARFRNEFKGEGMNNRIWTALVDSMLGRVDEKWWSYVDHKIQYPLYWEGLEKSDIIRLMPDYLMELVWYCRNPKDNQKPCECCASCIAHRTAVRSNDAKLQSSKIP